MSTLLLELKGNKIFNKTIFAPYLFIFDDLLIYRKRFFFNVKETTISYNQIAQVNMIRGVFFSQLDVLTTGTDDIIIRYINKKKALRAKKIIDQKVYHAHYKRETKEDSEADSTIVHSYEKSLNRLKELLHREKITKKEFEKKKQEFLKKLR